jgi:daunorubicin/doxorubicin transport system permease protein
MTAESSLAQTTVQQQAVRTVVASGIKVSHPSAVAAALTFGWRGLLKIKYVPEQLIDIIAIPAIFTLMFTYLFGGALAGSTTRYLQFILPGTVVMAVIVVTMYAGVGLNSDITKGVSDRFRSLPVWRPAPILGALLGDIARYLLASLIVIGLGLILGFRPGGGAPGVALGVVLAVVFGFGLSWVWTTVGLILRTPNAVMNLGVVVLFPLTFASNIFVDPRTMPGWVQAFVRVNPVTHLSTAERGLMQGTVPASQIWLSLLATACIVAVFAPLTSYLYRGKH